jgi:hypothetical protein
MRVHILCSMCTLCSSASFAQQPAAQTPPPPKLVAGSADVTAMIAKAKTERKPDHANYVQPIVRHALYTANLEYRVAASTRPRRGMNAGPSSQCRHSTTGSERFRRPDAERRRIAKLLREHGIHLNVEPRTMNCERRPYELPYLLVADPTALRAAAF